MVKNITKRTLSMLLVFALIFSVLPMTIWADSIETGVAGLTGESDGKATWTNNSGTITGSVSAKINSGCTGDTYEKQSGTLKFTNNSGSTALISFDYTVNLKGGSATLDGDAATGGSFSKALNAGGTVEISITSNEADSNATTFTINNLKLTPEVNIDITFKKPTNGSYTVDGVAITVDTVKTAKTTDSIILSASPASGYKFFGWFSTSADGFVAFTKDATLSFSEATTIEPRFVLSSDPVFQVGAMLFTDLNEAVSYSQSSGIDKITLIDNGTLPAGNYTIPNGKTLLVPMDATYSVVKEKPTVIYDSYTTPSSFRTLSMASGANITIQSGGSISLASNLSSKGQLGGNNGTPTGPDGRINMASGSSITVKNGGNLYAWGYIYGSGSVTAESGATVYEAFQIKDWRGGTATSNVYSYAFILNQYYVQNIEVPLTLYAGATEKLYSSVNASSSAHDMGATFVGNGGMFNITSGYIVKDYIESTDRLQVDAYGSVSITPMTLTGLPLIGSLSTDSYILPINGNITINIHEGVSAEVTQDIELLPSAEITIDSNAAMKIADGHRVYVYDNDDWGNFTGSARLYVIGYSVANGTTTKRTAAGLKDATINVNGTLTVEGSLYTSNGHAAIVSSNGTGKIVLTKAPGNADSTIYEMANNKTKTAVVFNPAFLQNADGTYYETAGKPAGTEIPYSNGFWGAAPVYHTVTWKNEDGTVLKTEEVLEGTVPVYEGETPTKAGDAQYSYTFTGWDPEPAAVTEDVTYTAVFSQTVNTYTVKWLNEDGSILETDENVAYGATPEYNGEEPTKDPTASTVYTFTGWTPEVAAVTGDVSYTATFSESTRTYTITWKDQNGEVIETTDVAYGEAPFHAPLAPYQDEHYSYSFAGWKDETGKVYSLNDALPTVDGDAVYTAVFSTSLVNGYYLIGLRGWNEADLRPEDRLTENQANPSEMMLEHVTLQVGNEFKVVYLNNGEMTWYPENAGNYVVDAGHAGEDKLVIFNPKGTGSGDGWHAGYLFVELNEYTVTWKNWDGSEIRTERYYHGEIPSYLNADVTENPSRQEDEAKVYSFDGWNDGTQVYGGTLPAVTADVVYTAHFAASPRMYDILWIVGEEEIHSEWAYGATPEYMVNGEPTTPEKASDEQYSYTFAGWSDDGTNETIHEGELPTVTGETTYIAVFNPTTRSYTVTWNVDGVSTEETYEYGEFPVYKVNGEAADPVKEGDAQYTYTFTGWDPQLDTVTADVTYTAQFSSTVNKYRITFKNGEAEWYDDFEYGTDPAYGGDPINDYDDEYYNYHFAGWKDDQQTYEDELPTVTGEATYTAVWQKLLKNGYYVIGPDWSVDAIDPARKFSENESNPGEYMLADVTLTEGEYIKAVKVENGRITSWYPEGEENEYQVESQYAGNVTIYFRPDGANVNNSYWAHFGGYIFIAKSGYLVTFLDEDGTTVLDSNNFAYNEIPSCAVTPTKESTEQYEYTFAGWKDRNGVEYPVGTELPAVVAEASYTAYYTQSVRTYKLQFNLEPNGEDHFTDSSFTGEIELAYGTVFSGWPLAERTGYTFNGWKLGEGDTVYNGSMSYTVTGDADFYSQFTVNTYTVTWKNEDGTVLETDGNVPYGEMPVFNGETPTKAGDAQYSYTFAGWTPEIAPVTGDVTYTGRFEQTLNKYTVTWVIDGVETTEEYEYGAIPSHLDPVKAATAQYTYAFTGWTPEIAPVTGDATYTARFTETLRSYTVIWLDEDGTELEKDENVPYGTVPTYDGETPTKAGDAEHSYTFAGWNPSVTEVTGDATYTATYTEATNTYTVTWLNYDGTELEKDENVPYGTVPTYDGATPTKPATAQYSYTFAGWTPEISAVTGNVTYTATFTESLRSYTIRFVNDDDSELLVLTLAYGTMPEYTGATPTKAATAQYTYTFSGWTPEIVTAEGDATYKATYSAAVNKYTIRFLDEDGMIVLQQTDVEYGKMPAYTGTTPTKADDNYYSYSFDGWTPELEAVTGPADYKASFSKSPLYEEGYYLVGSMNNWTPSEDWKFTANEGSNGEWMLLNVDIPEGAEIKVSGYFNGTISWYPSDDNYKPGADRTGRVNVYFRPTGNSDWDSGGCHYIWIAPVTYTITWKNDDGSVIDTTTVAYGTVPTHADPTKAETPRYRYSFAGWTPEVVSVTGDATYTARFDAVGKNGLCIEGEDTYWIENGENVPFPGLIRIVLDNGEINYYYFGEDSKAVKDGTYHVDKNNNLRLPVANYNFDANGVIEHDPDTSKNGVSVPSDNPNGLFYMIDGVKVGIGLLKENGSYYYARTSNAEIVRGRSYYVSVTNGYPIEPGMYVFDSTGKMILNGFFEENGCTYYYKDGVLARGFTKIGEDYYFFNAGSGRLYKDIRLWVPVNEYGVEPGYYYFGVDGKMELPAPKNGFVEEGGYSYYYVNGERAKGFTKIGEDYYFFNAGNGRMYKNIKLWVPENEYGVEPGYYDFGAEGKMILPTVKNGFVEENGSTYYYVDGEMAKGLTKIGEDFYFFNQSSGKMYKGMKLWVADHPEYGIVGGMYQFDEEGRMVLPG